MWWWHPRHSAATIARLEAAFPFELAADVRAILRVVPESRYSQEMTADDIPPVVVSGEVLRIPYRVYFPEPSGRSVARLTPRQRLVLAAIFTRNSDGYVRERCLREVIRSDEPWVVPFVVQLLGEYVIEIASAIDALGGERPAAYAAFVRENPSYWTWIRARMISYWSYYYRRRIRDFSDYPFYQAARTVGAWNGKLPRCRRRR